MPDFILLDGDLATFLPAFGNAVVAVQPGTLHGSGPATVNGKKVCVTGDEQKVIVPGCTYTAPPYINGTGTLKIAALAPNQRAMKTKSGGLPVLLKGAVFTARFEVMSPAQDPALATPDPLPMYVGMGLFVTTNVKIKGT